MKNYVITSKSMTTYDSPAPYGEHQIALRELIDFEAKMLEKLQYLQQRIGEIEQETLALEIERRQEFFRSIVELDRKLWGR